MPTLIKCKLVEFKLNWSKVLTLGLKMSYQIKVHSAQFKMGISNAAQLSEWLTANPEMIGISFVGRSNVGKSSIINSLFGSKTARVSKTPGRTREINIFEFQLSLNGKNQSFRPSI